MTVFTASTTAQALAAITAASGNDTVLLAPGTYDGLQLSNLSKSSMVTITSQFANDPAVLSNFSANRVNGLKFTNLEFNIKNDYSLNIMNSHVITFDHVDVHGTLNGTSHDDFRAMSIKNSSFINVTNSHFHELTDGINHYDSSSVNITGNTFDLIRDNGIAGGGTSNIVVGNNLFTDFDHEGGIHPDAIQFWTTNTKTAASNITVTGNVFDRGDGEAIQGIFIKDDVGRLPFVNVTITNNVIAGGIYNGISITGAVTANVTGNTVIGTDDQMSWLGLYNVSYARLDDNIATNFTYSNSGVNGNGDVLASALQTQPDGSYASGLGANVGLSPQLPNMAATASAIVLAQVDLSGFVDGPSRFGHTYNFSIANVFGTSGDDRLAAGPAGGFHLYGYDGNDTLIGSSNQTSTILEGGSGDDNYTIYQAIDTIVEAAGGGTDTVYSSISYTLPDNVENLRAASGGLTLTGNALDNTLSSAAAGDTLYGLGGNDVLIGNAGVDRLFGGLGDDTLRGNDGNDYLNSDGGNDKLYGGAGNDTLIGGTGADYYEGGLGADTMTGGVGIDTYVYRTADFVGGMAANRDTITNFSVSDGDKISLSMVDAVASTATMEHFSFIGAQAFHGVAGELRYGADGDGITVFGDTNGDRVADIAIHLVGLTAITASSFTL